MSRQSLCLRWGRIELPVTACDIRRWKQWQDKLKINKAPYPPQGEYGACFV